jgi:hypothetical protein
MVIGDLMGLWVVGCGRRRARMKRPVSKPWKRLSFSCPTPRFKLNSTRFLVSVGVTVLEFPLYFRDARV